MFAATVKVLDVPAGIMTASPITAWGLEFKVLAKPSCVPVSSKRTIPAKIKSLAKPDFSIVTLFRVTGPSYPAVTVNLVNGILAAPSGVKPLDGCAADETVMPVPDGAVEQLPAVSRTIPEGIVV